MTEVRFRKAKNGPQRYEVLLCGRLIGFVQHAQSSPDGLVWWTALASSRRMVGAQWPSRQAAARYLCNDFECAYPRREKV